MRVNSISSYGSDAIWRVSRYSGAASGGTQNDASRIDSKRFVSALKQAQDSDASSPRPAGKLRDAAVAQDRFPHHQSSGASSDDRYPHHAAQYKNASAGNAAASQTKQYGLMSNQYKSTSKAALGTGKPTSLSQGKMTGSMAKPQNSDKNEKPEKENNFHFVVKNHHLYEVSNEDGRERLSADDAVFSMFNMDEEQQQIVKRESAAKALKGA